MERSSLRTPPSLSLLPLRLVVAALTLGPAMLLGVLLFFDFGPKPGTPLLGDFMTFLGLGIGFGAIVINVALSILARKLARSSESDRGFAGFALSTIGGAVVFTFAAFFAT